MNTNGPATTQYQNANKLGFGLDDGLKMPNIEYRLFDQLVMKYMKITVYT